MKKTKKKVISSDKPSDFLAAGYTVVAYTNGSLLLQKGADLRLFSLTTHREGTDPVHGTITVSFAGKVP
jgi:hypothetical protein